MGTLPDLNPDESEEEIEASPEDQDLSLLVVKTCHDDQAWASELGSRMFLTFDMDGDANRVASFWAIIHQTSVDLFRMAASYDSGATDDTTDMEDLLLIRFQLVETELQSRSREILDAFKQIYDIVASCGAPVHGLVLVNPPAAGRNGRGERGTFYPELTSADARELFQHANARLGRRIDFVDVSGCCANMATIANIGPFCQYILVSDRCEHRLSEMSTTKEILQRQYLEHGETVYHILDLPGRSVLAALNARARFLREKWHRSKASSIDGESVSIFRTKHLEPFLRVSGKLLAASDVPAVLASSISEGQTNSYDLLKLLHQLPNSELLSQFLSRLCLLTERSSVTATDQCGLHVDVETILRWVAAFDELTVDERRIVYKSESVSDSLIESLDGNAGLIYAEVVSWNQEPVFPDRFDNAPQEPLCFPIGVCSEPNSFFVDLELPDGLIAPRMTLRVNGVDFSIEVVRAQGAQMYIRLDRDHGASQGDIAALIFRPPLAFDEIDDHLRELID